MYNKTIVNLIAGFVLFAILGLSLGLFVIAVYRNDKKSNTYSEYTTPLAPVRDDVQINLYAQAREEFMSGCDPDGIDKTYCSCLFDEMISSTSLAELENDGNTLTDIQIVTKYQNQINACL